jgi:hypothetical protein
MTLANEVPDRPGRLRMHWEGGSTLPRWGSRVRIPSSAPRNPRSQAQNHGLALVRSTLGPHLVHTAPAADPMRPPRPRLGRSALRSRDLLCPMHGPATQWVIARRRLSERPT